MIATPRIQARKLVRALRESMLEDTEKWSLENGYFQHGSGLRVFLNGRVDTAARSPMPLPLLCRWQMRRVARHVAATKFLQLLKTPKKATK